MPHRVTIKEGTGQPQQLVEQFNAEVVNNLRAHIAREIVADKGTQTPSDYKEHDRDWNENPIDISRAREERLHRFWWLYHWVLTKGVNQVGSGLYKSYIG